MLRRLSLVIVLMVAFTASIMAQITTSGINGKVTSQGDEVIGASVTATHQPSGTVYRAVTNVNGRFNIPGMRPGGPYKIEISYIGHQTKTFDKVNLLLGESQNFSCSLEEDAQMLDEVVVAGKAGLNATKTGAAQSISATQIANMPTVTHSIADIARLNPQINSNEQSGSMSFAGTNNRYNAFQIDGVMNNDTFGLTYNGSNGGQASTQPVSMETIDQIQINIAPFDVRQSGFTGGSINAITKSGTNQFHGSVYGYGNNEKLVGRHYRNHDGTYADPYSKESESLFGFTLGGPIIKDKLFFFANYENSDKSYPNDYGLGSTGSKVDADLAVQILDAIKDMAKDQGYEYNGNYANPDMRTWSNKAGVKLDWNINDFNKFTVRWSYVNARSMKGGGGIATLNTGDHLYEYKSTTNTFMAELQSRLSPVLSNEARASYVSVRDARTSGNAFPAIQVAKVGSNNGTVNIGNEYNSMANGLDEDVFTFEDNLTWYKGNHTVTFGTHNEVYKFSNLYIPNLFGSYYFQNTDDFFSYYNGYKAGTPGIGKYINQYYFREANVDVTGNARWEAEFGSAQLGFYVQDKWDISNSLQLTYGLRMDLPIFFNAPSENAPFNEWAAQYGYGYKTQDKLKSTPMWSPRVGFRWDKDNRHKLIVRGGVGVFTGRVPFVWLANSFSNTGIQMSSYSVKRNENISLILDPNKQSENGKLLTASNGNQTINVFDNDFKFAQTLRANLGVDFNLLGISWTAEAIYSKTLNDVYYQDIAYSETGKTLADVSGLYWDNRPMYERVTTGLPFQDIYVLKNTNKGYTYSLSLKAEKNFDFGLDLAASYTFTESKSICPATSSQASSNWGNTATYRFSNAPELSYSAYNIPHMIKASAFYHFHIANNKMFTTTIGLIYQGRSGSPYSMMYSGDINGDNGRSNDLIFIPTDEQIDQMSFKASGNYTEELQRQNLKAWLAKTPYLKDHRGEYFKRNGDNLPFENHFDFHFAEKMSVKVGKYVHALELSLDILNVGNLLNKDWGRTYGTTYANELITPLTYDGGQFQFLSSPDYVIKYPNSYYSRWRGQIGLKYTF